jgi:DNA-binding transcriptional LysR family regulator
LARRGSSPAWIHRVVGPEALDHQDDVHHSADHIFDDNCDDSYSLNYRVPRSVAQTGQVAAAAHLAACSLGVTIVPSNVLPRGLDAGVRSLKSPLAEAFLEALVALPWGQRPHSATLVD